MSSSTEPTQKPDLSTEPTPNGQPKGFTPLGHSLGTSPSAKALPSARAAEGRRVLPLAAAAALALLALAVGGYFLFFRDAAARADILLHTVKREPLVVTVTEKGTLESAGNKDIVCKVRAGAKGYASTINWVIDDGSRVKSGQLLMILDDSALKDQEEDQ